LSTNGAFSLYTQYGLYHPMGDFGICMDNEGICAETPMMILFLMKKASQRRSIYEHSNSTNKFLARKHILDSHSTLEIEYSCNVLYGGQSVIS